MTDEINPETHAGLDDHVNLTDDQLIDRLHDHRKGSGEWAAALGELLKRGDRVHSNARFQAALGSASDGQEPPGP